MTKEDSFLANQDCSTIPIRRWVCVNQPVAARYIHRDAYERWDEGSDAEADNNVEDENEDADENEDESENDDDEYSVMASSLRSYVLAAATKFANGWARPSRKRKCDIETANVHKKLKLELPFEFVGNSKTRKSSTTKQPLSMKRKVKINRAPIKRYLRSVKKSEVEMASKPHKAVENICTASFKSEPSISVYVVEENRSSPLQIDGEPTTMTSSDIEKHLRLPSTSPTAQRNTPELSIDNLSDDGSLTDLDDSIFDDEDLILGDVTEFTNLDDCSTLEPQMVASSPIQPTTLSSNSVNDIADHSHQTPILPFLRGAPEDPIKETKYSLIPRLVASYRIPTCFRIAEALRLFKATSNNSNQPNTPVTIELFIKVSEISVLSKETLRLRFTDIFFPHNPPFITGIYTGPAFRGARDGDTIYRTILSFPTSRAKSSPLVQGGLANSGSVTSLSVQVLALREADWSEIKRVYRIVDPDGAEMLKKRPV